MARLFDDASSHAITTTTTPVTDVPLSMACWFNSNDVTASQTLLSIGDTAANAHHFSLLVEVDGGSDLLRVFTDGSSFGAANSAIEYLADTWQHACGVWAASDDRSVYLDGGNKGTDATDATVSSLDALGIGVRRRLASSAFMSGLIAEAAIWNIALTDEEVAILAAGYSPLFVRPQNLVFYAPLIREILDVVGGVTLTNVSSTVGDHPRMIYPAPPHIWTPSAAVAALASQRLKIGHGR